MFGFCTASSVETKVRCHLIRDRDGYGEQENKTRSRAVVLWFANLLQKLGVGATSTP